MTGFLHYSPFGIRDMMPGTLIRDLVNLSWKARHVVALPGGPGSMDDRPLDYSVVDGNTVHADCFAAYRFFSDPDTLRVLSLWAGRPLRPSPHLQSFININVLTKAGQDYQLHRDGNAVTLILSLSALNDNEGGHLEVMHRHRAPPVVIPCQYGGAVLFAAGLMPHRVTPLAVNVRRVTLPVAYDYETGPDTRPPELDRYLYGDAP